MDTGHMLPLGDRQNLAQQLNLSVEDFNALTADANYAYDIFRNLGPFYGREDIADPTFRVTARPVFLTKENQNDLERLGNDLLILGKALGDLPDSYKKSLGSGLDFRVPIRWRVDAIIDANGNIRINEVEGVDGANALMIAEQLAYKLQTLQDSTAAKMLPVLKEMCGKDQITIAIIKASIANDPHAPNARRFAKFLEEVSGGSVRAELLDGTSIQEGSLLPDWDKYDGILNESRISPDEITAKGAKREKIFLSGNYNALCNKGVFALVFEKSLQAFWEKHLGKEVYDRLTKLLIPSYFINSPEDIRLAREKKQVVKVSWAGGNTAIINRSRGVAMPEGDIEQNSEDRWEYLGELLASNMKIIGQEYVVPGKIHAYLRKKGTTLEEINWYNRICIKYVCSSNPNTEPRPDVSITALEATLGPDVIPAGRKCAFTAAAFSGK